MAMVACAFLACNIVKILNVFYKTHKSNSKYT